MNKSAEYRRNAQEFRALARSTPNEQQREQLLRLAEGWDDLAKELERAEQAKQQVNGDVAIGKN